MWQIQVLFFWHFLELKKKKKKNPSPQLIESTDAEPADVFAILSVMYGLENANSTVKSILMQKKRKGMIAAVCQDTVLYFPRKTWYWTEKKFKQ